MIETFSVWIMCHALRLHFKTFINPWKQRRIGKSHLTNTVKYVWNTWCKILSDTGKLPAPWGGYKFTSLKLLFLNNLTHKRLCERCVDWKSIECPQPHTSLSQCWHQHFFKMVQYVSPAGTLSESTLCVQNSTTLQTGSVRWCYSFCQFRFRYYAKQNRGITLMKT